MLEEPEHEVGGQTFESLQTVVCAQKLGTNVNSAPAESRPSLSRDGRRLYFGSTRQGMQSDICVATRAVPPEPRR
jgi:hypothetical protein